MIPFLVTVIGIVLVGAGLFMAVITGYRLGVAVTEPPGLEETDARTVVFSAAVSAVSVVLGLILVITQ